MCKFVTSSSLAFVLFISGSFVIFLGRGLGPGEVERLSNPYPVGRWFGSADYWDMNTMKTPR